MSTEKLLAALEVIADGKAFVELGETRAEVYLGVLVTLEDIICEILEGGILH
jgi:hypothetical protein